MNYTLKNAFVYTEKSFVKANVNISNGRIVYVDDGVLEGGRVFDFENCYIFPGLIDVHVHLREPGFSYKETMKTGTKACARGGYTSVCSMPNLNPVPDSFDTLKQQLDIIENDACINVYPFGAITKGEKGEEMADLDDMAPYAIGFSDDGKGVQNEDMMVYAMEKAKEHGKIISAHCEDNNLLFGGYIHDGEYAKLHGHRGICSESEWGPIKRDIELVKKTGCKYHVCHISTKESVELIRHAKKDGVNITCETAPHYLTMNDMMLQEEGRFKMNPPIRGEEDRLALVEGLLDGTIDMIATDHAPHSKEEKTKGLEKSMMGVVGIETAFATMYTNFVKTGKISLEKLMELMHDNAKGRFNIGGDIKAGEVADLTVFDLDAEYVINP
ncbi:MAG: dihydroorotase, partial [Clostridia bacterium]|nr:dihydroorotase [Clostridia bacterium]